MATVESTIPVGLCQCGCGAVTSVAAKTDRSAGYVKGVPLLFRRSHNGKHARAHQKNRRGFQRCGVCKQDLPVEDFYRDEKGRPRCACKPCSRSRTRDANLRINYGLSPEDRRLMNEAQGRRCALCGRPPSGKGKNSILQVDHDHRTGKVRALLCNHCNSGLGYFRDDEAMLLRAIEYLRQHRQD